MKNAKRKSSKGPARKGKKTNAVLERPRSRAEAGELATYLGMRFGYEEQVRKLAPATSAQIRAIEEHFGGPLPPDYVEFLQAVNGGMPRRTYLYHSDFSFDIESLHGIGAATDVYDVLRASSWPSEVLKTPVVAIGGNGAGDQLIFLRPKDPSVYQWVHDEDVSPFKMARSFREMIGKLRTRPDE